MTDTPPLFDMRRPGEPMSFPQWECVTCGEHLDRDDVTDHVLSPGHSAVPVR